MCSDSNAISTSPFQPLAISKHSRWVKEWRDRERMEPSLTFEVSFFGQKDDWLVVTGTWLLFSPIVGMMIQSDELIFFRGVGIPPIRWWESLQTNVRFLQIQQQKNAGIIHSSACYTPSHRSWSDPFPVNQGVLKHNMNGFLKGN